MFLDESGIQVGMTRLYGRAPIGQRVVEAVPDKRFQAMTLLSSMRLDGEMVPFLFEGALNSSIFRTYVEVFLVPTLRQGDIVIMDNLSSHKSEATLELIFAAGASVRFLPPYSPDLNPIELMWSKLKSVLKKLKTPKKQLLLDSVDFALRCIYSSDVAGWFMHDGYALC